tara:strand:+ start:3187 stop:4206 length:1020 start_codon:yes stop_codon:yes gene_type:complete
MEDYNSNLLNESKNEWCTRFMNIISPHIIQGFKQMFNDSLELCNKNDEHEKYLMTFQNFLASIPKWNQSIIDDEVSRIVKNSNCIYLEDLITCIHVLQIKILSCVRTGNENKKIDIDIPKLNNFIHKIYINIARKLYSNIYLFQLDITSLEQQKNNREFENIVQISIMNTVRDNIPIDKLLRQYIDETQEIDVVKKEKIIDTEIINDSSSNNVKFDDNSPPSVTSDPDINNPSESVTITQPIETNTLEPTTISEPTEPPIETSEPSETILLDEPHKDFSEDVTNNVVNYDEYDDDEYITDNNDSITIGENVDINLDSDNLENTSNNEDYIDLGIEELKL